jgi:uncharacterized protein (TIGR02996 family)
VEGLEGLPAEVAALYRVIHDDPLNHTARALLADALDEADDPALRRLAEGYRIIAACKWVGSDRITSSSGGSEWLPDNRTCWFNSRVYGTPVDPGWELPLDVFNAVNLVIRQMPGGGGDGYGRSVWTPFAEGAKTAEDALAEALATLPPARRAELLLGQIIPAEVRNA